MITRRTAVITLASLSLPGYYSYKNSKAKNEQLRLKIFALNYREFEVPRLALNDIEYLTVFANLRAKKIITSDGLINHAALEQQMELDPIQPLSGAYYSESEAQLYALITAVPDILLQLKTL